MNRKHSIFYGSSYDRGLSYLLYMWQDIRAEIGDAQLHICYGWDTFMQLARDNPERMEWKKKMEALMNQEGIIHHGRVGKSELNQIRNTCGVWAYPTDFFEINCITALEAQKSGCVPVVMDWVVKLQNGTETHTALHETVGSGVKVSGDIRNEQGMKDFKEALIRLMNDRDYMRKQSMIGKKFASKYSWNRIAEQWMSVFSQPTNTPLVSVVTPTIRRGFWNIMGYYLSNQTYKNIEWIVVDDYKKDRTKIANEYFNKYGIKGKYLRGKGKTKFFYGLSSANNIGWENSKGELLVWLQDFILPPLNGIESLVNIYNHHPNCLIAPVDKSHLPSIKPDTEKEDWFDGRVDVVGDFKWENIRCKNMGMRFTEKPTDWEVNYAAIPRHIIEDVGGWYEFFNDGLGFDNTELAYRALQMGYQIIIDDTNQATGIDHWEALENKQTELGEKRDLRLNDLRYEWMITRSMTGKLPLRRDPYQDNFRLEFELPHHMDKTEARAYMETNKQKYFKEWDKFI